MKFSVVKSTGDEGSFGGVGGEKVGEEGRFDVVIAVDEADELAGSKFEPAIATGGLTGVFLMNDFDARVFFGVVVADFTRIVGRAIIDEDEFEVFVGLVKNGVETGGEVFGGVPDGNDD